ncbi:MAG: hypothetical protein JNJ77_21640 [Planctomycetia bacterium]|nr:hypothetical protein [Planctomycetia bacterium]
MDQAFAALLFCVFVALIVILTVTIICYRTSKQTSVKQWIGNVLTFFVWLIASLGGGYSPWPFSKDTTKAENQPPKTP